MLDSIAGLASEINNTISEKLPIIMQFNSTLRSVIDELTTTARAALATFNAQVNDFNGKIDDLSNVLHAVSQQITDAGTH